MITGPWGTPIGDKHRPELPEVKTGEPFTIIVDDPYNHCTLVHGLGLTLPPSGATCGQPAIR